MGLPVYPFDPDRCIGTVTEVSGTIVRVNLPQAAAPGSRWHHGYLLEAGRVGEFVVIEAGESAVFGRITAVRLPERERLTVEDRVGAKEEVHPIGMISMMATASLSSGKIEPGVPHHPRLAARCFSAHPALVKWLAEHTRHRFDGEPRLLSLAVLPFAPDTQIRLAPESLFGRHCAILGATGGGKSWTVARLVGEAANHKSKIILIDPTGEYCDFEGDHVKHVHVNKDADADARGSQEVMLPHRHLTEEDLFALFTPSPQTQQPRLRSAIKSLKVTSVATKLLAGEKIKGIDEEAESYILGVKDWISGGRLQKAGKPRLAFENAIRKLGGKLDGTGAAFDIKHLAEQINLECVRPTGRPPENYGDIQDNEQGWCTTLVLRVEQYVSSPEHGCLFGEGKKGDLIAEIRQFTESDEKSIFILSLKELSFSHHLREIFVNAIGRTLLLAARAGRFRKRPVVVFLDEAHQFVGKVAGDEFTRFPLDAFELIAKEGRKYGLCVCLATQRPRDIGQGILSQMGSFLVHRLTNPEDREMVEKAAGDLDRSAASFIPTLAAGQAVLIGIDFPIPVTLDILPPAVKPVSSGPKFQEAWA